MKSSLNKWNRQTPTGFVCFRQGEEKDNKISRVVEKLLTAEEQLHSIN